MEIEIKPISLDERLKYLQKISEYQKANAQKFPWLVAVVAFFIGGVVGIAFNKYRSKKEKEVNI